MTADCTNVRIRACIVIPVYRHALTLPPLLSRIRELGLFTVLVNDGGDEAASEYLRNLRRPGEIELCEQFPNRGKGAAVLTGLRRAAELGYTHCVQIDADGQHNPNDIPLLLAEAEQRPEALITGVPRYDASVPQHRLYARYITHFWVWVETLSLQIRDSMCGFRVYPLESTLALARRVNLGQRMDFDTEVMVRLYWRGLDVVSVPTQVTYPEGGVSNFHLWRDNLMISAMHTRLVCGMLVRLPLLLWRKIRLLWRKNRCEGC
jgi:glycosyltransferase involved in cell wall biosynthesis